MHGPKTLKRTYVVLNINPESFKQIHFNMDMSLSSSRIDDYFYKLGLMTFASDFYKSLVCLQVKVSFIFLFFNILI